MFDLCHPSYYKISQLGCTDGTKITIAFYVYIELCEVKRLWDVEYKYNSEADIIYIKGKKTKSSAVETYIPWPALYKISVAKIEDIQEALNINQFIFVFRGGDSTSVYYRITKGLVKPITPAETKKIKQEEEKKFELEQEIRKNTSILFELAKSTVLGENKNVQNLPEVKEELQDAKNLEKIQNTENQVTIQDLKIEQELTHTDISQNMDEEKSNESFDGPDSLLDQDSRMEQILAQTDIPQSIHDEKLIESLDGKIEPNS